ncbi:MAG: hypothetical protein IJ740_00655 [Ruminococcus sp.]|nr:hypothetical protein [Ruminococcus sp.]
MKNIKNALAVLTVGVTVFSLSGCMNGVKQDKPPAQTTVTLAPMYEKYDSYWENVFLDTDYTPDEPIIKRDKNAKASELYEGDYYPNGSKDAKYHIHVSGGSKGTLTFVGDVRELIIDEFSHHDPVLDAGFSQEKHEDEGQFTNEYISRFMSIEGFYEMEYILKSDLPYRIDLREDSGFEMVDVYFPEYFPKEKLSKFWKADEKTGLTKLTDYLFAESGNFGWQKRQYIRIA